MKEFIKRNAPIFGIGALTVILFIFIIISAGRQPKTTPQLLKVDEKELIPTHTFYKGPADAKVTLVEFSDYGCPYCKAIHPVIEEIYLKYPNKLKWAFRHFPLPGHKNSDLAAEAAQIAGEQGKFWEYTDKLYENQGQFEKENLAKYAMEIGLDQNAFKTQLESKAYSAVVKEDYNQAIKYNLGGTPSFFLNGELIDLSAGSIEDFVQKIVNEIDKAYSANLIQPDNTDNSSQSLEDPEYVYLDPIKNPAEFDLEYPEVTIKFDGNMFDPEQTQAFEGQKVTWINTSNKPLALLQSYDKIPEPKQEMIIEPEKSFTVRMQGQKLWMYKDANSGKFGTIFIKAIDSDYE